MPASIKWKSTGGGAYVATGLWGEYRIRPPLSWSKGYALIWGNIYDYPYNDGPTYQELGSFSSLSAAKSRASAHLKELKSTAVG